MTIDEILTPTDVILNLRAKTKVEAVDEVLSQLRGDSRVKDWSVLRDAILKRDAPALADGRVGLCIAHGRTPAVGRLVVAVGRSVEGVFCPEVNANVQLFFVAGIPSAVDSEYLRIVGAIARVCRDSKEAQALMEAGDAESFIEILATAAERLV